MSTCFTGAQCDHMKWLDANFVCALAAVASSEVFMKGTSHLRVSDLSEMSGDSALQVL